MKNILCDIVLSMMNYKSLTSQSPEMFWCTDDDDGMKWLFNFCAHKMAKFRF